MVLAVPLSVAPLHTYAMPAVQKGRPAFAMGADVTPIPKFPVALARKARRVKRLTPEPRRPATRETRGNRRPLRAVRSETRRAGKEGVSTCKSGWSTVH